LRMDGTADRSTSTGIGSRRRNAGAQFIATEVVINRAQRTIALRAADA